MRKKKFEIKDYEKIVYVSEPDYSEKGKMLAFTLRKFQDGDYIQEVFIKTENGEKKITAGGRRECVPRFSPDGTKFAFLSDANGIMQLWIGECAPSAEKKPEPVATLAVPANIVCVATPSDAQVTDYAWSPDSTTLLWLGERNLTRKTTPLAWADPIVATGSSYRRESDGGWQKSRETTVNLWNLSANEEQILHTSNEILKNPAWSSDGKTITWTESAVSEEYDMELTLAAGEGACRGNEPLVAGEGACRGNEPLAAGEGACRENNPSAASKAVRVENEPLTGTGDLPDEVLPFVINGSPFPEKNRLFCGTGIPDTRAVIATKAGRTAVYLVTAHEETQTWKKLTDGTGTYSALCQGEPGFLYALRSDWRRPFEIVKISLADGTVTQVTDHNPWLEETITGNVCAYQIPSLDGNVTLDGWLMRPAMETEPEPGSIPAVLLIHGGPASFYGDAFNPEAELLAAAGMAVLMPNPRGSSGYGAAFGKNELGYDGTAYQDLLYYLDNALRAFPWIDANRLGVAGGSYGGYMAAWMAGHCKRFRAAAVLRGLLNFQFLVLTSEAAGQPGMLEEPKDYEDFLLRAVRESPTTYAQDMDIPMLIMHGEDDVCCPVDGAHQLYVGVKDTHPDLPVKLILFPKTGHKIRAARLDYYERYEQELVNWMKSYCSDST
ncbi:MAG: prolyl oligopeptidase family serine peptidase [Eubacteriales bacterium]|nr:prolyl oligopeptidase family serine peptidase [Eubacteriales bacterium]